MKLLLILLSLQVEQILRVDMSSTQRQYYKYVILSIEFSHALFLSELLYSKRLWQAINLAN